MLAELTSTEMTKKEWSYLRGSQTKGNLTFSFAEMWIFLSWFNVRIIPLEKCNNFYILYLSRIIVYIIVAYSTQFSTNIIFIPVYSGDCLCETVQHVWNRITAVKSSWIVFHSKYLACSICDRVGNTRQFPFRSNYIMCWNTFWYFSKILFEVILNHLLKQCGLDK
jgi:hypothetical protein